MAEETQNSGSGSNEPKAPQPMFWLAFAALFAMLFLAVAAMTLISKNTGASQAPQITITNASNNKEEKIAAAEPALPASAPSPVSRPNKATEVDGHRMTGQLAGAPEMLPGALATPTMVAGRRDGAALPVRADSQSLSYVTLSSVARVAFRVRGLPGGPAGLNGPVPSRVRAWNAGPDGRVAGVQAGIPAADDAAAYSYLPEVAYKASSGSGPVLGISVVNPRKTSVVNALRAPRGFQFFVADITAKNTGAAPFSLEPDMFEVQDSDKVPYLPNPELLSADFPRAPVGASASARFTAAFLVPADASLTALVAREPGDGLIVSPLNPQ